ncbi:ADP-ribosylglycohydrolase family protein [Nocardiopsis sp. SBT366]|uniref:ADP-ribosylglycohydrolase family protein n=1 Tax=Nocardiopsis sp. SBT366 TaxID=1580529 RepID=UPI000AECC6DC|nr:ADP-ribosylglycohydrolase family protein [Nocardiopsis sp. SBT366]
MRTPSPLPDRLTGCLIGGAIGDALGAPVEGLGLDQILERHGPQGLTEYVEGSYGIGAITDETQLTLRTCDALVRASVRARNKGISGAAVSMVRTAYVDWARIHRDPARSGPTVDPLHAPRGYGAATVAALRETGAWKPVNNSKGCAAVVRVAPCGFGAGDAERAFELATEVAALTHGHRTAHLAAGVFASTVWGLVRGGEIADSLARARELLEGRVGHGEVSRALDAAVAKAHSGVPTARDLAELGDGWTSEEALAVAVCVALRAEDLAAQGGAPNTAGIGQSALRSAVNHSGDSDTLGALCGNLVGARYGVHAFPGHWQSQLEVRERVIGLAADAALEYGPCPPAALDHDGAHETWTVAHFER